MDSKKKFYNQEKKFNQKQYKGGPQVKNPPKHYNLTPNQSPPSKYKSSGRGFSQQLIAKPISHSSKTSLVTNHFPIKITNPKLQIHIYSIHVLPSLAQNQTAFVINQLIQMHDDSIKKLFGSIVFYTQANTLYSLNRLKDAQNLNFDSKLGDCEYNLEIRYVDSFCLNQSRPQTQLYINQCLKYLMKRKLNYTSLGNSQSVFNMRNTINFKQIRVIPGFHSSAKMADSGMFLVVEPTNKFMVPNNMLDMFNKLWKIKQGNMEEIQGRFNNIAVIANYGNRRIYRVVGIDLDKTPENTKVDNQDVSIFKYYLNTYNIKIKNPKQPLLLAQISHENTIKGKFFYLVPELVSQAHIPPRVRNNRRLMQECCKVNNSNDQFRKCIELSKSLQECKSLLNECGLDISDTTKSVQGYNLQRVKLNNGQLAEQSSMKNSLKYDFQHLQHWAIVYNYKTAFRQTDEMYNALAQFGSKVGIKVAQPEWLEIEKSTQSCYAKAIRSGIKKHKLVVVVLEKDFLYPSLKKICAEEKGIVSQFVVKQTLNCKGGKFHSIVQNLIRQIQAKLGHDLYQLQLDKTLIDPKNKKATTMIVGYDVSHRGSSSSMVGFCASINRNLTQFYSNFFKQEEDHQEIVAVINREFQNAIENFKARNSCTPELILVYRDGVGDSMIEQVIDSEIKSTIPILKRYRCKVCFMTVNKRTHERFFFKDNRGVNNAAPGTAVISEVVQRGMTQPLKKIADQKKDKGDDDDYEDLEEQKNEIIWEDSGKQFDFFLIPHKCGIGVAKATHIHVIYNDSSLSEKVIVELSNTLCYGYFNWAGAVRIPSACMYAHKLSLFATTVKCKPNKLLNNNLHFL